MAAHPLVQRFPKLNFLFRMILTTVLITSKFFNDTYYANQFIASVGGVSTRNLN